MVVDMFANANHSQWIDNPWTQSSHRRKGNADMQPMRKFKTTIARFSPKGGYTASEPSASSTTEALALNWLEGHSRIMAFWLERLVAENGDIGLIDTLHEQSAWLQGMQDRLTR